MFKLAFFGDAALETDYRAAVRRFRDWELLSAESGAEATSSWDAILVDGSVSQPSAAGVAAIRAALARRTPLLLVGAGTCPTRLRSEFRTTAAVAGALYDEVNVTGLLPAVLTVKQALGSGKLGELGLVRLHVWCATEDNAESRGALGGLGWQEPLDLILGLFQKSPETVRCVGDVTVRGADSIASWQAHLGFAGGGMALLDVVAGLPGVESYFSLSAIGSQGAAYADDHHNQQLVWSGPRPAALRIGGRRPDYVTLFRAWREKLAAGAKIPLPGAVWPDGDRVAEAVIRSGVEQRPVALGARST